MNKKLHTIALATALASLGLCGSTYGWQTSTDSYVGSGIASNLQETEIPPIINAGLPPIVSGNTATGTESVSPPIVTGKLIKQVSAESVSGKPVQELPTFSQGGGLKPLNSIMTSERPPHVYRPPAPPVTKKSQAEQAKAAQKAQAPVARVASAPATAMPQGSSTRNPIGGGGSSTRTNIGGGSSTRSVLDSPPAQGFGDNYSTTPRDVYSPAVGDQLYSDPNAYNGGYADPTFNGQASNNQTQGGCATCGNSLVDGSCSTCGPGAAYSDGPVIRDFGTFGSVSAANKYLYLDALVMTRADGDIENSNFGTLNDFDFTGGLRATYGVRNDSIFGSEISFFGLPSVEQSISRTDPLIANPTFPGDQGGRLTTFFLPVTGAPSDAFTGATAQSQRKESDLYSVEFNRVNWGWDLIKTFSGIRMLSFQDSYNVQSTSFRTATDALGNTIAAPVEGDFTLDASNFLVGAQVGGELFYDVGYRWSASGFGKFGIFANFNDFDTNFNNGNFNTSSESDNATVSTVAELGALLHYQIRTNLRFRAGYQGFFIGNVATTADNLGNSAGLFTGAEANDSDDVFFHGFNFGLEFYR